MDEIIKIKTRSVCIVHFKSQELIEAQGGHMPHYQVTIDPNGEFSPSGDFVRFNQGEDSELHGWQSVDEIVIDDILEEVEVLEEVA